MLFMETATSSISCLSSRRASCPSVWAEVGASCRLVHDIASIASRIFDAAPTGSRRTSLPQTRTTVQPSPRSRRVTCRSRWRFRSIFATQYDAFQPSASLPFLFDHLRPCQKSPSQKTTTRCLAITKSGRPINAGGCKRYRTPAAQRAFRKRISGVVF